MGLATLQGHFSINQAVCKPFTFLKMALFNVGCAVIFHAKPINGTRPSSGINAHLTNVFNTITLYIHPLLYSFTDHKYPSKEIKLFKIGARPICSFVGTSTETDIKK